MEIQTHAADWKGLDTADSRGVPCTFLLMGVTFCYGFYLFVLEFHLFFHILDFTNSNYFVCIVNTEDTSVVSSNHLPDR